MNVGEDEKTLGKRLQQARQAASLTQQQLCQQAGLSYSTLAKIERGAIKAPSIFTIAQIAAVLKVSLDDLTGLGHTVTAAPIPSSVSKSGIKFAYFDINGCLVRFFHRAFTQLATDTGIAADIVETAFWHYNDAVCRGEMPMEDFNRKLAEQLRIPNLDWLSYYLAAVDPIDEMKELLGWAAEHYRVGLLSNIMPGFINAMKQKGLIPDLPYAAIVDSSEVNAIKPEQKIYQIAQEKTGLEPHEILLVDDSRTNVMAAEKMGWHVLWFDDYRPEESAKRIRSALELADNVAG
jgi:FMN phosphatase YigB (HAD superfamily)/DNA-binding XRE family transcriptional regulator